MHVLDSRINRDLCRIFGIGDTVSLRQMRICLGLSSIPDLIEVRKRNFMDRLIENDSYVALLKVFVANCFESNLVL